MALARSEILSCAPPMFSSRLLNAGLISAPLPPAVDRRPQPW